MYEAIIKIKLYKLLWFGRIAIGGAETIQD